MKFLFWTDGFWPRLGGVETQGLQFIEGMQQRGHQYMVLTQRDHSSWKEDEIYLGIPIKRFDFNAIVAKRDLKIIRAIQDYLESVMREFQPDVVHLNASVGGSAFAFLLFIKMFRVPIISTVHAPYLYNGAFPSVIEKIASFVDQICCVSNWVFHEMEKLLPEMKHKMRCIYNGLPMPDTVPLPLSFSPPILLAFGRLVREKGFDTAILAFSLLKKRGSNAQLILAGGGPERPALELLAGELDLGDSVVFTGVLTQEEVTSTFNRATIVLVPSIIESFGLVILEAMQMGRPVIASRVEGVPEVIVEGETGILVPKQDPIALCEAIEDLLAQPEKAIQMGMQGRKRAIETFTLDQNVLQYEEVSLNSCVR